MQSKGIVYIVDDDAIIRRSLCMTLNQEGYTPHPFVCGGDFIDAIGYLQDGCVLLDMHMPGISGLEVQEQLIARGNNMPLLIMTGAGDIPMAVQTMKRGAVNFIEKPFDDRVVLEMIEDAFTHLDSTQSTQKRRHDAALKISGLTPRERDVLRGLIGGRANKLIAFDMDLSVRTVEMHRGNIMRKLGIHSTAEALQIALDSGLDMGAESQMCKAS